MHFHSSLVSTLKLDVYEYASDFRLKNYLAGNDAIFESTNEPLVTRASMREKDGTEGEPYSEKGVCAAEWTWDFCVYLGDY